MKAAIVFIQLVGQKDGSAHILHMCALGMIVWHQNGLLPILKSGRGGFSPCSIVGRLVMNKAFDMI